VCIHYSSYHYDSYTFKMVTFAPTCTHTGPAVKPPAPFVQMQVQKNAENVKRGLRK
jgi:hypothetical protein